MNISTIKRNLIRSIIYLAFIAMLIFTLTACGDNGNGDGLTESSAGDNREQNAEIITFTENYVYLPTFFDIPTVSESIHASTIHDGRIYFVYVKTDYPSENASDDRQPPPESTIVIGNILPGGETSLISEIPNAGAVVSVVGLHITDGGNFALIFSDFNPVEQYINVIYAEFSPQGAETGRREIDIAGADAMRTRLYLRQAVFMDNGYIALFVDTGVGGAIDGVVYLLDENFSVSHRLEAYDRSASIAPLATTWDGRLFTIDQEQGEAFRFVLREIYIDDGVFGETFPLDGDFQNFVHSLHGARESDPFDLYIVRQGRLVGFDLESETQVGIINWIESGVTFSFALRFSILDNQRLSVLTSRETDNEANSWETDHILLIRTERAELPTVEIITVGTIWDLSIGDVVRAQAAQFNLQSRTHQIEFVTYVDPTVEPTIEVFREALDRFILDIIAGRGPDIILGFFENFPTEYTLDLYQFIDADPELSRTDFFPNILALMEAQDGTLPFISYTFELTTMIGMSDMVGNIETWTFAEMRSLVEQAFNENVPHILTDSFDREMSAEEFLLLAITRSDLDFINLEDGRANLDSDGFIELLELAAYLSPDEHEQLFDINPMRTTAARMRSGEQLLRMSNLVSANRYHMYREIFGDDMVFLGLPSSSGGRNEVFLHNSLAISAASEHQDAAWEFIRGFLMPGVDFFPSIAYEQGFSLRIDDFEAMVEAAMTPMFEIDADGNEVEIPRISYFFLLNLDTDLYALSQEGADELRSIVESANIRQIFPEGATDIILEEWHTFFRGTRSAADTARVMQNRVQILLYERN